MSVNYRAAWVPEQEHRDWNDAAVVAVDHIEAECAAEGVPGVLVTEIRDGARGVPALTGFVARYGQHITRRSRGPATSNGPTLVYVPYVELLEVAARSAHQFSLCAVEAIGFKLGGWAAATGALNLDTGEATPPPPSDMIEDLERLVFTGNNGWADQYGKRDAGRILPNLRAMGADFVAGYVIGKGRSASGAKRLHQMLQKSAV